MAIGFIGLGNIGKPMAQQLLKLGEELWVYDIASAPVAELSAHGARAGGQPRELAQRCRIIGLCVRDEQDVETLLYGEQALLAHMAHDSVLAVHSTVTRSAILRWADAARARGIHLLDAPMTGGAAAAAEATLTYMVGGEAAIIARCRPLWATSGRKIVHAGPAGAGMLLKLCNNLMAYAAFLAIHEGTRLARAGGLDCALLTEVGRSNGVVTPQMETFLTTRERLAALGADALAGTLGPFAALGAKDLAAALASARELGLALPGTQCVAELIEDVFLNRDMQQGPP